MWSFGVNTWVWVSPLTDDDLAVDGPAFLRDTAGTLPHPSA
jgi:hypothetical protein